MGFVSGILDKYNHKQYTYSTSIIIIYCGGQNDKLIQKRHQKWHAYHAIYVSINTLAINAKNRFDFVLVKKLYGLDKITFASEV